MSVLSRWRYFALVVVLCGSTASAAAGPVRDAVPTRGDAAKDDLRSLAVAQETFFADHGRYASIPQLENDSGHQQVTVSKGMTLSVVWFAVKSYCASAAFNDRLGRAHTYFYGSAGGELETEGKGCSAKRPRSAKSGGSVKGAPPLLPLG